MAKETIYCGPDASIRVVRVGCEYAVLDADTGEVFGHRTYSDEQLANRIALRLLNAQYRDDSEVA